MLSKRQEQILIAILTDYVATAEPVGSRTISKKYDLNISPATVRNDMSDLEDAGLIHQPYTSAGRIPSDEGYRYYVEYLLPTILDQELPRLTDNLYYQWLSDGQANNDDMRDEILHMLSEELRCATLLYIPKPQEDAQPVLAILNLVYLAPGRALMIVVADDEEVNSEIMDIPYAISEQDLAIVNGLLNHYLRGLPPKYWAGPLSDFLLSQQGHLAIFIKESIKRLATVLSNDGTKRTYTAGILNVVGQPEFQNIDHIRKMLMRFNHSENIVDILGSCDQDNLVYRIGSENIYDEMHCCSVVVKSYRIGKQKCLLGVLGPKRMNYLQCSRHLLMASEALETTFNLGHMLVPERCSDLAPLLNSFAWQLRDMRN